MREINYFGDEQKIYYEKLKNGLTVYIAPNANSLGYHAELVTKYGSEIEEFIPINEKEYVHLPLGVAHFLEHKTFDMEGADSFNFFSKYGTYANAGTSYYYTKYYIDGKKCFEKNLDYLLSMIFTPFFDDNSIENEKNIIAEEIKMYDDEPEWIIDYEFRKCFFKSIMRDKIAGTVDSIKKINKELLQKVYDTFYQPSNMFLAITGNVNIKKVMEILHNNKALNTKETNKKIVYKEKMEDTSVLDEYKKIKGKIVIPKIKYGYKFSLDDFELKDKKKLRFYLGAIFSILFNDASKFNEDILEKKLSTSFYSFYTSIDNIYMITIDAESDYADLFVEEVEKTLNNIHITNDDFERIKKVWYSIIVRGLDNNTSLANSMIDDLLKDNELYDNLELINILSYDELQSVIKDLNFNNKSFILMVPEGE